MCGNFAHFSHSEKKLETQMLSLTIIHSLCHDSPPMCKQITFCDSVRNFEWNIHKEERGWGTNSS